MAETTESYELTNKTNLYDPKRNVNDSFFMIKLKKRIQSLSPIMVDKYDIKKILKSDV